MCTNIIYIYTHIYICIYICVYIGLTRTDFVRRGIGIDGVALVGRRHVEHHLSPVLAQRFHSGISVPGWVLGW